MVEKAQIYSFSSQFLLIFLRLDGKHVIFGRVLQGQDIVKRMESVGSDEGTPQAHVAITECGQV